MSSRFIETARNVADRLCQSAFWHGPRCNWVGRSLDGLIENGPPSSKALAPEIYEGTSGIALFLSNMYVKGARREEYRQVAKGAMNHAISRVDDVPSALRFGLYSGKAGIAYAAAEIGKQLGDQELIQSAAQVSQNLARSRKEEHMSDMISGTAGAIPSLLKIHQLLSDRQALELAVALGDELISTAVKDSKGWSWDYKASGMQSALHNLTGFSHGASGMAHALLELYSVTDEKKYRNASEEAFRYENHWYSDENKNWPDFRTDDQQGSMATATGAALEQLQHQEPVFATAWCHGAPGISLARLQAWRILKDEKYISDIQAGLDTTARFANEAGMQQMNNFSLCHGLAGIGEVLLHAYKVMGDNKYRSLAADIGRHGISKYADQGQPWPCDARVGETLGLMIGIAGIGSFYLHLANSDSTGSPLIITTAVN